MAFAILKLSYNQPGDSSLTGGICGTGFFVDSRTAVTAHHCLNNEAFRPNEGLQHALVWIIERSGSIRQIERDYTSLHPELDVTIISFPDPVTDVKIYECGAGDVSAGLKVCGIGHVGNSMPKVNVKWQGSELIIQSVSLASVTRDMYGSVKRLLTLNIHANDIEMHGVRGFELSFGSQVGMSGGPVVDSTTSRVLGMLSAGLPPDSVVKNETFAVSIDEILKRCV